MSKIMMYDVSTDLVREATQEDWDRLEDWVRQASLAKKPLAEKPVDPYLDTISRLEPSITIIDQNAGLASIAISLKRIANSLQAIEAANFWRHTR